VKASRVTFPIPVRDLVVMKIHVLQKRRQHCLKQGNAVVHPAYKRFVYSPRVKCILNGIQVPLIGFFSGVRVTILSFDGYLYMRVQGSSGSSSSDYCSLGGKRHDAYSKAINHIAR